MTQLEPPQEPIAVTQTVDSPKVSTAGSSRWWILSLLLLVLLLGLVGFGAWRHVVQVQTEIAHLTQDNQQQELALDRLNRSLERQQQEMKESLDQQFSKVGADFSNQAAQLQQLQDQVAAQHEQLDSLAANRREDWMLAEAEYLLKVANQQILLERSPSNAITLLESADATLKQLAYRLGDAGLFSVREVLADELLALKLVVPIDREGIFLQLNSLAEAMANLPRVPNSSLAESSSVAEDEANQYADSDGTKGEDIKGDWWQRLWGEVKALFGTLDNYIRIESVQAPAKPLVDQYTTQAAVLNVRLLLEQAQVALLKEQPVVYQSSLQQARALLGDYFIVSPEASEVLQKLEQLEQTQIAPTLPDISGSLERLQAHLRQRQASRPSVGVQQ